jgi:crotonobetainyl-CoA:carnitine CoA-transferase CaiB-like acyl-CoA transferase
MAKKRRTPLEGVRVLDFTWQASGPFCTRLLALMGAEVIKVESRARPDIHRRPHPVYGREEVPSYEELLAHKKSVTLNLKHPEAVELARRLAAVSDVVVENFRPGVMDRLGLGYEALRSVRPDIIMVSCSAAGQTGPERLYAGYAPIFAALGGLGFITGYEDGPPVELRNHMDHAVGLVACFATLAALLYRKRTGRGLHVDVSSREVATWFLGEVVLDYTMNGRVGCRRGNRDEAMAPHNVYPCRGEDRWVSIAVGTDAEWEALCRAMGRPDLAQDPRFSDGYLRHKNQEELDEIIAAWTRRHDAWEVAERLQAAGVAAMVSVTAAELVSDPHLKARGAFLDVKGPDGQSRPAVGLPWRFSETDWQAASWPPELGAHNREVLGGLLGLSEGELARLEAEKAVW